MLLYHRETDGRSSDGAGLVAFMMGVTSHYITDINWHGLGETLFSIFAKLESLPIFRDCPCC